MSDASHTDKPWAGRFTAPTDAFVEAFTASVGFDKRLYRHDIAGSIAHARMLAHVGVLSAEECRTIVDGLQAIEQEIAAGEFAWSTALEDVHMNIEARLTERIGEVGKTSGSICARNWACWHRNCGACRTACWIWPSGRRRPSCRASPICRPPSR